jgi:hypothetical protein
MQRSEARRTEIHLTDDQRRALQAEQDRPIDVIDPATQQRYVLLAREQSERMRSLLIGGPVQPVPATEAGTREAEPLRQRVGDLLLPPEVAAEARRHCKRLGLWGRSSLRHMENQLKVQHYYGGRWIASLETSEGLIVVAAAASLSDPLFDRQLSFLTAEERQRVLIESPTRLFDQESELLTPFSDES